MRHIDILLTNAIDAPLAPANFGELEIAFHVWEQSTGLPLFDGPVWAFLDWIGPQLSGLETCRRLRCDPLTAQAHITMVLEEDDLDARRKALRAGADDYMVGPVTRTMLLDRVMAAAVRAG